MLEDGGMYASTRSSSKHRTPLMSVLEDGGMYASTRSSSKYQDHSHVDYIKTSAPWTLAVSADYSTSIPR